MTLRDAFHNLTIEQVEKALAADETHGFPQDVFGLARLMLRTFSVLDPRCIDRKDVIAEPLEIECAVKQRVADMLDLERAKADQFDEDPNFAERHSDTRH